jgi:hypothetical protein
MESQTGLDKVKQKAMRFLHFSEEDQDVIDIAFATYVGNKLDGDPLWTCIVGPPASGKTEIIASMDGYEGVYLLSSLTPNTLLSGKISPSQDGRNASLLFRLDQKVVLVKDLTTIITLPKDTKGEVFSQLREIYDGSYSKAYGTGSTIIWRGKIGLLAGVTPAIDKQLAINQLLGERFLYYRMHTRDHPKAAKIAFERTTGIDRYREDFRQEVWRFLAWLDANAQRDVIFNNDVKQSLINLAILCAHARSAVLRDRRDQTLQSMPEPEGPSRMVKQLSLLAKALAIVRGEGIIDWTIYAIVKKVARDSLPRLRLKMLEALWDLLAEGYEVQNGKIVWPWHRTSEIAERANLPLATARLTLEDLMLLGLVKRAPEAKGSNAHVWQPSKRMFEWGLESEFFVGSTKAM